MIKFVHIKKDHYEVPSTAHAIGSDFWFRKFGYHSEHDHDYIILDFQRTVCPKNMLNVAHVIHTPNCVYDMNYMRPDMTHQDILDARGLVWPGFFATFLHPTFFVYFKISLEFLKELESEYKRLADTKWSYLYMIYQYYITNERPSLTEDQLNEVYQEYLRTRKKGE